MNNDEIDLRLRVSIIEAEQLMTRLKELRSGLTRVSPLPKTESPRVDESTSVFSDAKAVNASNATAPASEGTKLELDMEGLPWDGRIHSSARTKLKNGNWKLARNVSDELVEQVKAELAALYKKFGVEDTPTPPTPPTPPVPPPVPPEAPIAGNPNAIDAVTASSMTFADFVQFVASLQLVGAANESAKKSGLGSYMLLSSNPEKIPVVLEDMGLIK